MKIENCKLKILFVVIDGLSDRPIKRLGNKTPLEAAKTPNLDQLAQEGLCGLIEPVYTTAIPTSEEAHFGLFGYSPRAYKIRRGIFTTQGAGINLKKGDVALRGNFSIVDKDLNIIDRRAGRISKTQPLIKALSGIEIDGVKFLIKPAGQHRLGLVMRGRGLSSNISDSDPHYSALGKKARRIRPLAKTAKARFTAQVLNKFLAKAHQILKQGKFPANYILTRGASSPQKLPSFWQKYRLKAACVAGKLLYQQIAGSLGMTLIKVRGADGSVNTNLKAKFLAAKKALYPVKSAKGGAKQFNRAKKYDFVFLHVKATDSLSEDGNFQGKKQFIEKIDRHLPLLLSVSDTDHNRGRHPMMPDLLVVTADHSTCCGLRRHCQEPVPVLIWGKGKDQVKQFSEKACCSGKLGKIKALALMPKILYYVKN